MTAQENPGYCRVSVEHLARSLNLPEGTRVLGIGYDPVTENLSLFVAHADLPAKQEGAPLRESVVLITQTINPNVMVPQERITSKWHVDGPAPTPMRLQ